jgi:hypothetical protein
VIDWQNLFSINLDDYGLVIEGYLGDYYFPWRTLFIAVLIIAGRKAWKKWQNK